MKMRFMVKQVNSNGERLGILSEFHRSPNAVFETPTTTLFTKGGSVAHLTADVLDCVFKSPQLLWVPLSNSKNLETGCKYQGEGITKFSGLSGHIACATLHDLNEVTPNGHFEGNKVPLWTRNGKQMITAEQYIEIMESFQPDLLLAIADGRVDMGEGPKRISKSVDRTRYMLDICVKKINSSEKLKHCALIGTLVGGLNIYERKKSLKSILTHQDALSGVALAGITEGGPATINISPEQVDPIFEDFGKSLPSDMVRIVEGCWNPAVILSAISYGWDVFDGTYPAKLTNAGHALAINLGIKSENVEHCILDLNEERYKDDFSPLLPGCSCTTCTEHNRAYINHLLLTKELLAPVLLSIHNLHHFDQMFREIRKHIAANTFQNLKENITAQYNLYLSTQSEANVEEDQEQETSNHNGSTNKKNVGPSITKDEVKLLLHFIEDKKILTLKSTNRTNNLLKENAWTAITEEFNISIKSVPRSAHQLRLKWENLKKTARKRSARIGLINIKTGTTDYVPPDEILDKVAEMLHGADMENRKGGIADESTVNEESDSDDSLIDETYVKNVGPKFTKDELKLLLHFIEDKKLLSFKSTNRTSNLLKENAWTAISDEFNHSIKTVPRTPHQLRLKWENLKTLARKRSARIGLINIKTGTPDYVPPDEILDKVAEMLHGSGTGVANRNGENADESTVNEESDSDDSLINETYVKNVAPRITNDEVKLLVQLIEANKCLNKKRNNKTTILLKDQAWSSITEKFNASVRSASRSTAQLRLKWENLKKASRKRSARMYSINTWGGKMDYIPPDEILDKVAEILEKSCIDSHDENESENSTIDENSIQQGVINLKNFGTRMTNDEVKLLVQLIDANKCLTEKRTNKTTNLLKDQAWSNVTEKFNASVISVPRSTGQLRLKWENMKKSARKRSARMALINIKTGTPDYIPPDEILDKVAEILHISGTDMESRSGGNADESTVHEESDSENSLLDETSIQQERINIKVIMKQISV